MLYPLTFRPIFKERVWGGRKLEALYQKPLPPGVPIGESWEISDRPGDVSVITNGPLAGKDLHWLMTNQCAELLGSSRPRDERFPLLIKILDAQEKLSLQVHPPAEKAIALGGEPKTEMWQIVDAGPDAELFVGLKHGVTYAEFKTKINSGTVDECFHRLPVKAGDAIFLPSGRVHAIGAGLVIFEIQQNSDTTYRVHDWNRVGLDGKPRDLHISQSMASIDFSDFEPSLITTAFSGSGTLKSRSLVRDPLFSVDAFKVGGGQSIPLQHHRMQIVAMIAGKAVVESGETSVPLSPGGFCLIPASLSQTTVRTESDSQFLRVEEGVEGV
jgi:mannose-6-phosphate isomerase